MHISSKINSPIFILSLLFLCSCITPFEPIASFQDNQREKEEKIEAYVQQEIRFNKEKIGIYESLAYGDFIVYKPQIFHALDSLYAIKDSLIRANQQREIVQSNIELYIEEYRGKAKEQQNKITYETEHIYCIRGSSEHSIYSEFFYMNYQDSVMSTYEKFHFTIPRQDYTMYKNYLFEMHFITPRDLYISELERNFITFFKSKEKEFYKTVEHEEFIKHTLKLMTIASNINTLDFVSLSRLIGTSNIREKSQQAEIINIGSLIALEDNFDQVIGYELEFTWNNKENKFDKNIVSTIEFDPYLRIVNCSDQLEN